MIRPWILAAMAALLPGEPLVIRVASDGWGDAGTADIEKVLRSAGESLSEFFPDRTFPPLEVSRSTESPITFFKRGPKGEIRVKLNVEGRHWAQFAFQFGHEVGHIVCGFEEYPNPNAWFEETLCEAAALFVLGRMSESWKENPPYPNWKGYAESLRKYREDRMKAAALPDKVVLADWFREREASLRKDATQRDLNLKMAAALLPLFEEAPERWGAVATLNAVRGDASRPFGRYLSDWARSAPAKHRELIGKIADRFGIALDR